MATITDTEQPTTTELVHRFQADIWRYLRFLGCPESAADDLTQETFLAVIRRPFEYRGDAAAVAYLRKVARNQLLMSLRSSRRAPSTEELEAAENVWARNVGADYDAYLDALEACLDSLVGRQKQVVDLHYRDGQSRKTVAAELDMTDDGVKTLLRRTRARLRECVERRLNHDR